MAASALTLVGCSSTDSSGSGATASGSSATDSAATGPVTVFAAASLKATFTELGRQFEQAYPGSKVDFQFAGSSDLAQQIIAGAPADVFASADTANMTKVTDAHEITDQPVNFASNTLTIAVAPGNPKGIATLADLTRPDVSVVVCAPQVPCGSAAVKVEQAANVDIKPVSEEQAVTDVLGKVTSGQADAGLVYRTDASGAGDKVTAVPFAESSGVVNIYPIGVLADAKNATGGREFAELVAGPQGRDVLQQAGFGAP
ncbi:molybdate ABC transporter substrate-binding protein [Skermania piniformis]|uniref:molybdate ABC transporter substrate-binding protein n=1 Tax=Skermania pinensis TaxID=39122 RepID=UPI00082F82D7